MLVKTLVAFTSCLDQKEDTLIFSIHERNFLRWTSFSRHAWLKHDCPKTATNEQSHYSTTCQAPMTVHVGPSMTHTHPWTFLCMGTLVTMWKAIWKWRARWSVRTKLLNFWLRQNKIIDLGFIGPAKSTLESALRAVSYMSRSMAFLGKQQHKIIKNNHDLFAICYAKCVPSVTFRTTRSTRLFAQMMRRAGCHDFNWAFKSFR